MIELLAGLSAIIAVLLIVAIVYAVTYRQDRDEANAIADERAKTIDVLDNRITVLKGDNIALEAANKLNGQTVAELTRQREDLKREIGRMEAERRAEKLSAPVKNREGTIAFTPARDEKGRFLPKPKAAKALKATPPKPVACG